MKRFDFSRYILVCRKQFVEDWRRQVGFTAVMAILLFFIFWIVNWQIDAVQNMTDVPDESMNALWFSFAKVGAFAGVVLLAIGYQSAHSMPFMKSKTLQISHVVLPATTLEKYLATETFAFVFSVIEAIVAFFIADSLQYFLTGKFTIADISLLLSLGTKDILFMTQNSLIVDMFVLLICTVVASLFFHSAWFTLCATFFRKHPFLFGMLILWGINQVLSIFDSMVSFGFLNNFFTSMYGVSDKEMADLFRNILYIAIFGQIVLAIGFWIWSYYRMKRIEL